VTVAERKAFLLRVDPAVLDAVQRWANDDLRSLNGQIEFLLRRVLKESGRGVGPVAGGMATGSTPDGDGSDAEF
jgi:hypothetical protein